MKDLTILFDLDGTLLPMDQEKFTQGYFKRLAQRVAPLGYEATFLFENLWKGVSAMVKNDGRQTNEAVFWQYFVSVYGEKVLADKPIFNDFYAREFQQVAQDCGFNPEVAPLIQSLKSQGYRLVLATNPLFPTIATESRIRWAGLSPQDFEYYTTYENAHYCKPNPLYYQEILDHLQIPATACLMVGNDVVEDMVAASLGMKVFLLTDCLINTQGAALDTYPHGNLQALQTMIQSL